MALIRFYLVLIIFKTASNFEFPHHDSPNFLTFRSNGCRIEDNYKSVDGHEQAMEEVVEYEDDAVEYDNQKRTEKSVSQEYLYSTAVCEKVTSMSAELFSSLGNKKLTSIIFKNSNISLVPVGVLSNHKVLTELYINDSNVNSIHPGAFTSLDNLNLLHLDHNCLTKITKGILNSLPNLNVLNLSYNNISDIEEHAFLGLFKLKILDISFNRLEYVLPNTFQDLKSLRKLDLSHNLFLEFDVESAPKTVHLDISYNLLSTFNFSVFDSDIATVNLANNKIEAIVSINNVQIGHLDLSNNNLTHIDCIESHLKYLNFSGNQFNSLTDNALFNASQSLQTLDFSSNLIEDLSTDIFAGLLSLRYLLIQNNLINNIPVGCFRNLKELTALNVSSNLLVDLDYGTFTGLSSLIYLDLSNNKLSILYDSSFQPLKSLRVLSISGNLLKYIDPIELLDISKTLMYVSLHNNLWSCKSLAKAISTLEKNHVVIEEGSNKKNTNHHGIACDSSSENEVSSKQESVKGLIGVSEILNSIRKYFDSDFLKSQFYKYFESLKRFNVASNISKNYIDGFKLADDAFVNTKLYKFLNNEIPPQNPLKQLLKDLTTALQNLNNAKVLYTNVTFQKNTFDPNILKDIKSSLDKKLDQTFDKVDTFIDKIFNHSKFAELFNNMKGSRLQEKKDDVPEDFSRDFQEHFSAYTANETMLSAEIFKYLEKLEKKLEQKSEQSGYGNTLFFCLTIVLLLTVVIFISFNRFVTNRWGFCKRLSRVSPEQSRLNLSNSRIEMV